MLELDDERITVRKIISDYRNMFLAANVSSIQPRRHFRLCFQTEITVGGRFASILVKKTIKTHLS